jgi:hypothetical protein
MITFFAISFVGFWLCYLGAKLYMYKGQAHNKIYHQELTKQKQADYISRIVANIHAVISSVLSLISIFALW